MQTIRRLFTAAWILVLTAAVAIAQAASPQQVGTVYSIELPDIKIELKEGDGKLKVEIHCAICHSVDYVPLQPKFTRTQWTATVNKMIKTFGAQIGQEDADAIVNYLTVNYGTEK